MIPAYHAFLANPDPLKWAYLFKLIVILAVVFGGGVIMLVQSYRK